MSYFRRVRKHIMPKKWKADKLRRHPTSARQTAVHERNTLSSKYRENPRELEVGCSCPQHRINHSSHHPPGLPRADAMSVQMLR